MTTILGSIVQKTYLTDRFIKALKPSPAGKRITIWDAVVPGFGVRVSDRADPDGKAAIVSFIVMRRMPGARQPTRVTIGRYHHQALPLAKAREEARKALGLLAAGTKPTEEKKRLQSEAAERRVSTVGAMAEEFIADMNARELRNAREFEAIVRREFLGQRFEKGAWIDARPPIWRDRPLVEITPQDAARLVRNIKTRRGEPEPGQRRRKSGGPWAAHHALAIGKTMWAWALDQEYPITASPFERIKPKRLIGKKEPRQRTLTEAEIRWVWKAAERTEAPYGPLVRLLLLTGQRLSQATEMQRGELDLDKAIWTTPASKMKMNRPHATPLALAAVELVRVELEKPSHRNGYVFSTTGGERPFSGLSKAKRRLDALIEGMRKEHANGAETEPMPAWTLHDLRRTTRSNLPALGVSDVVAEAILAHARPGIAGIYDRYSYLNEKTDALQKWALRVLTIVTPALENVVPMRHPGVAQ